MTADEFAACIKGASPKRLDRIAELLLDEAWRMLAAGDARAGRVEAAAALFRNEAERRRA